MKSKFRQLCVSLSSCMSRPCWLSSFRFRFFPEAYKIHQIKKSKKKKKKKSRWLLSLRQVFNFKQDVAIIRIICHKHQPQLSHTFTDSMCIYMLSLHTRWINRQCFLFHSACTAQEKSSQACQPAIKLWDLGDKEVLIKVKHKNTFSAWQAPSSRESCCST